jgi:hypothetical protein
VGERPCFVGLRVEVFFLAGNIIGEFHHIVVETFFLVPAHVKNIDEAGMILRNLLVMLDAFELAFESALVFKVFAAYDFDSAIHACNGAPEIDFAVRSAADASEQFEIGDLDIQMGGVV